MRRPPEEPPGCATPITNNGASSNVVTNQSTTLDKEKQCEQLHRQWAEAEYQRIMRSLQVDTVTGSIGPLYYCQLLVAGQPVTALVDSFLCNDHVTCVVPGGCKDSRILRDYNQHPLRIGAVTHLEMEYGGKNVIALVYINAGQGQSHEPFLCRTNIYFF